MNSVVKLPIRRYHLGHSDVLDFAKQFTEYRMCRFKKQIETCRDQNENDKVQDILSTMAEELEIVRNSYLLFLEHCQNGNLRIFNEKIWLEKI